MKIQFDFSARKNCFFYFLKSWKRKHLIGDELMMDRLGVSMTIIESIKQLRYIENNPV